MQDLRIRHEGVTLAGTYSAAGDTVVVALHGAGAGTRDFPLYEHLHELLPPAGIGVVTFDRRGEGESTGDSSRGRFDVQAGDALAVLDAVDAPRVGLWGVSQGAWIGPLAAARSERVAFLTLIASTGVTPSEQMMYATGEAVRRGGHGTTAVAEVLELRRAFEAWVHSPAPNGEAELAAALRAASDEPWWPLAYLPIQPLDDEGRRLWIEEMDYDPRPSFAAVRVPTLLLYGADDAVSPVERSIEAWRQARGNAVDVVVIPGAGHDLTLPDGTLAPAYEQTLVAWLTKPRRRSSSSGLFASL